MIIIIIIIIIITIMIRQNKLRDLEAEMLRKVCKDVQIEPVLQEVNGEVLTPGTNRAADARLHILGAARLCLFYIRVCYRMQSLIEASPKDKSTPSMRVRRRECTPAVLEVEKGSFTPLVFTTTGGMADECKRYHS